MSATGRQPHQLFAVRQIVAVEIGGIDEDFILQRGPVVGGEFAELQGWVEPRGLYGVMVIDDGIASGGAREGRLGDGAAGEGVEQRRFADAGASHEHDDEQRVFELQRRGLTIEVAGQAFEHRPLHGAERIAMLGPEPGAQTPFQLAQRGGQGSQQRLIVG